MSQNEAPQPPESSVSPWAAIGVGVLIVLLIGVGFATVLFKTPSGRGQEPPPFDPGPFAELEIKGLQPDGSTSWAAINVPPAPAVSDELLNRGRDLFQKACAGCHGSGGNGDGPITKKTDLYTTPADLTQPIKSIKIRSTLFGGTPTKEDLFRTITRGLPGTPMLSFRDLPAEDRWAIVMHVRSLSTEYEKFSGVQVEIPEKVPSSPELLEIGKTVFERSCRNCHGEDGLGASSSIYDTATGKPWPGLAFARQNGKRMLSGSSEDDIARTLLTGLNQRNPMMSWRSFFYPEANPTPEARAAMDRRFWGTVWYVKSLGEGQPAK
ncbi:MAG TPA: c-type cytochrome [Planctomycetota bacterium]|nr:c-type cytochrome [Planctomycetota bacterium]